MRWYFKKFNTRAEAIEYKNKIGCGRIECWGDGECTPIEWVVAWLDDDC